MTEGDPDKRYIVKFDQVESSLKHEGKSNYGKLDQGAQKMTTQEAYEEWLEIMNLPPLSDREAEIWRRAYNCCLLNTRLESLDQSGNIKEERK